MMGFKRDNPGCDCCDVSCDSGSLAACLSGKCLAVTVHGHSNNSCNCCGGANRTWHLPIHESPACVWRGGKDDTTGATGCCPPESLNSLQFAVNAEIGMPLGMEPYIGVASSQSWLPSPNYGQWPYTAVAWELTGAAAIAAITTLCSGGDVTLQSTRRSSGTAGWGSGLSSGHWPIDTDEQAYYVCSHDGSSVTVSLEPCPVPPPPPPDCHDMDVDCFALSGNASITGLHDVHDGAGVDGVGNAYDGIVWTYENFNRPYNVTKTLPNAGIPAGSWCTAGGTGLEYDYWQQLGVQSDYNNPGVLLRYTNYPNANLRDEVYVYGVGFGITCANGELRLTKMLVAVQRWMNYDPGATEWPAYFGPLHQFCGVPSELVIANPAVITSGKCTTGTMGSSFSFDTWLHGVSGEHSYLVNLLLGAQL